MRWLTPLPTKGDQHGTGLGLSTVYGVVSRAGAHQVDTAVRDALAGATR